MTDDLVKEIKKIDDRLDQFAKRIEAVNAELQDFLNRIRKDYGIEDDAQLVFGEDQPKWTEL